MIRIVILTVIIIRIGNVFAFENLAVGTGITDENFSQIVPVSMEYAIADLALGDEDGVVKAFYKIPNSNDLYSVTSKIKINLTNYESRELQDNWPLTRWQYEQIDELVTARYDLFEGKFLSPLGLSAAKPLGCMNNTPLRYGDIEEDGASELVLILGNQLVVFSPDYEKTVFSVLMSFPGWYTKERTQLFFELYPWGKTVGILPQYQNAIFPEQHKDPLPGLRGYAKIYQGDLDGDDHSDIVVWRKLYQSRLADDAIEGFELLSNTFYHYERDLASQAKSESGKTGEYLPQATSENEIKSWLADNELTWSKGYPSVSECEGEEGQLIPEMHDALLNDPEVLK